MTTENRDSLAPLQPSYSSELVRSADLSSAKDQTADALLPYKQAAFCCAQGLFIQDRFNSFNALNSVLDELYSVARIDCVIAESTESKSTEPDSTHPSSTNSKNTALENNVFSYLIQAHEESSTFVRQLIALGFLDRARSPVCPPGYYLINERLKTVYCAIPKNACTLFKTMMVEHSEDNAAFVASGQNVHPFLVKKAQQMSSRHLLNCLTSDKYFKFTVLRNPLSRIVSGYLDKFVKYPSVAPCVQDIISTTQIAKGKDVDIEKSITFSEFVDYLVSTPDGELNDHWRPQHNFTASVEFDFVGQFEKIDQVVETLENKLGIQIRTRVAEASHKTQYETLQPSKIAFQHMHPIQLRALRRMPTPKQFLASEIFEKLSSRYREDIKLYQRYFG